MTQQGKLLDRFMRQPKDFTWQKLVRFLGGFGYHLVNAGKTSGSRVRFIHEGDRSPIMLHKPHPNPILKRYQLQEICQFLIKENLL